MSAISMGRLFPEILHQVNAAAQRVRPEGDAALALDRARDKIASVVVKRIQITNRVRIIQACATRGRGMTRADLDYALEEVVRELQDL